MKTLLWKQYVELRSSLLVMVLFGIALIPALRYFNSYEMSTLVFVLFCFAGPILALQIGIMVFRPEFAEETIHFLDTLPVPRQRIWMSKVMSGLVMVVVLYLSYLLVCWFGYNDNVSLNQPLGMALPSYPLPLLTLAPLFMFSYGVVNAMIPVWAATIMLLALVWIAFIVMASHLFIYVNFMLAIPLLTIVFLGATQYAFVNGEMSDATGRLWRVARCLALGIFVVCLIWIGLDSYAQATVAQRLELKGRFPLQVMADGSLIMAMIGESAWYDPIAEDNMVQLSRFDPLTRTQKQIGPRLSDRPMVDRTGTKIVFSTSYSWPGIVGLGFSHTDRDIKPHKTLMLYNPAANQDPVAIDEFAFPIGFSRANHLVYGRYRSGRTEVVELSPDLAKNVLASFTSEPGGFKMDEHLDMVVATDYRSTGATTINCSTGKTARAKDLYATRNPKPFGKFSAYHFPARYDSSSYYTETLLIDENSVVEKADWIPFDTQIIGHDAANQPIGLIPDRVASGPTVPISYTLSRFDPEKKTMTPILELGKADHATAQLSPSGKTCYVKMYAGDTSRGVYAVDLTAASLVAQKLQNLNCDASLIVQNDDSLLVRLESELYKYDRGTGILNKLF